MLTIVKWCVGIVSAIAFVALAMQIGLLIRAMLARATGKIPKGEVLIDFTRSRGFGRMSDRLRGPIDMISWYIREYLIGLLGVLVAGWIILEPFFPEAWRVSIADIGTVAILITAGLAAFYSTAMCTTHCADLERWLRKYGA